MKKIALLAWITLAVAGCAHNEHMASIEAARWDAYAKAMQAYYGALPANRGEIVDLQVDATGKLSGLKVYASDPKTPPLPPEPAEIKPWGAQMVQASSELGVTAIKWGAGLMAVKIVTENAGNDVRDSYNDNRSSARTNTSTTTSAVENSHNTDQTSTRQSYTDSYNRDGSIHDSQNQDNSDRSVNDGYNQDTDNSVHDSQNPDNRQNYDNDSHAQTNNYQAEPGN